MEIVILAVVIAVVVIGALGGLVPPRPTSPPLRPSRTGVAARLGEGEGAEETMTVWVPAVLLLEHMTITVYVPGEIPDQAADWPEALPDSAT